MGGACSTYGNVKTYVQNISQKTSVEDTTWTPRISDNIKMGTKARESKNKEGNRMPQNRIHGRALVNVVTDVTFT